MLISTKGPTLMWRPARLGSSEPSEVAGLERAQRDHAFSVLNEPFPKAACGELLGVGCRWWLGVGGFHRQNMWLSLICKNLIEFASVFWHHP